MVAAFLFLVSSPVVVAGGGNRVIKSTYMYTPVLPVLLPDGSAIAGVVAWALQREDSGDPLPRCSISSLRVVAVFYLSDQRAI